MLLFSFCSGCELKGTDASAFIMSHKDGFSLAPAEFGVLSVTCIESPSPSPDVPSPPAPSVLPVEPPTAGSECSVVNLSAEATSIPQHTLESDPEWVTMEYYVLEMEAGAPTSLEDVRVHIPFDRRVKGYDDVFVVADASTFQFECFWAMIGSSGNIW